VVQLALAVGCGAGPRSAADQGAPGAAPATRAASAERSVASVPRGFRARRVGNTGLSIALPKEWAALRGPDAAWPGVIQTFARLDPELALTLRGLAVPDSPLALVGFDRSFTRGFATTATVMVLPATPGLAFREWAPTVRRRIARWPAVVGQVRASREVLGAGEALRLEFTRRGGPDGRLATVQYTLVRGGFTYVVTYTTLPSALRRYAPLFRRSAATLAVPAGASNGLAS
jgi:hypothetical protein